MERLRLCARCRRPCSADCDVLVHGGEGTEAQSSGDLLVGGSSRSSGEAGQEVDDLFLRRVIAMRIL